MFDGLSVASSGERVNNRKNAKQNCAINPGAQAEMKVCPAGEGEY